MVVVNLAVDALTLGSVYALIALGFHLVYQAAGVIDFAHGEKVILATLIALTLVSRSLPLVVVFPAVVAVCFGLGAVYESLVIAPSRRRSVFAAVVASVGAALVLGSGHIVIWGSEGKPFPPLLAGRTSWGPVSIQNQSIAIWVVLLVVVFLLFWFMGRSRLGRGMVAAATDAEAAETVGVDARRSRMLAFALAFALAGLAGVLVAPITLAGGTGGAALTLKGFTGAILGGIESAPAVVAGALVFGLLENLVGGALPYVFRDPLDFSLLIVVLLLFPSGLFRRRLRRAF